jgi:hypothetical protein
VWALGRCALRPDARQYADVMPCVLLCCCCAPQVMYEMGEPYKSGVELLSFHTVSKVRGGLWVIVPSVSACTGAMCIYLSIGAVTVTVTGTKS